MPEAIGFPVQHPVVAGGNVYVIHESAGVLRYEPAPDRWTKLATELPVKRVHFGVVAIGGRIVVIGGCVYKSEKDPCPPIADVDEYDPAANAWRKRAALPWPRQGMSAAVIDGIVYAAGGEAKSGDAAAPLLAFDPRADKWSVKQASSSATSMCFGAHAAGGKLYVFGISSGGHSFEVYDPAKDTI